MLLLTWSSRVTTPQSRAKCLTRTPPVPAYAEDDRFDPSTVSPISRLETHHGHATDRTEADHGGALRDIERLRDAPVGTPEGDKGDVLTILVGARQGQRVPTAPGKPA